MTVVLSLFVGIIGMLLLLMAFILDLFKKITQDTRSYNILNITGGVLLTYYAYALKSTPFIILEVVWTAFAFYKLVLISKNRFK